MTPAMFPAPIYWLMEGLRPAWPIWALPPTISTSEPPAPFRSLVRMAVGRLLASYVRNGIVKNLLDARMPLRRVASRQRIQPLQPALHRGDQILAEVVGEDIATLRNHVDRRRVCAEVDRPNMPGPVLTYGPGRNPAAAST